jgi:hypothetical protein
VLLQARLGLEIAPPGARGLELGLEVDRRLAGAVPDGRSSTSPVRRPAA